MSNGRQQHSSKVVPMVADGPGQLMAPAALDLDQSAITMLSGRQENIFLKINLKQFKNFIDQLLSLHQPSFFPIFFF
jgi:hypothetical protein